MDKLEHLLATLEYILNTKRKQHIAGGLLFSVSLFFVGMTVTVITIKYEEKEDEKLHE